MSMKKLINKLFKFLNRSEISEWHDIHKMNTTYNIVISEYTTATMKHHDIQKLRYHLSEIGRMINQ